LNILPYSAASFRLRSLRAALTLRSSSCGGKWQEGAGVR
jgi:hypothetical protein